MTARTGKTRDGRDSWRCLENTGRRRFLVVESDTGTKPEQAAILARLAKLWDAIPLVLVVDSAGKSLHGWFDVRNVSERRTRLWFEMAVMLGADPHTWTRCQWVRMPGGTRLFGDGTTKRQEILTW